MTRKECPDQLNQAEVLNSQVTAIVHARSVKVRTPLFKARLSLAHTRRHFPEKVPKCHSDKLLTLQHVACLLKSYEIQHPRICVMNQGQNKPQSF